MSTPLREEQSFPKTINNYTEAVNQVKHDHIPEGEAASNDGTQIDQLEDPGVIDKAPQESKTTEPIGNSTCSGRSIKLMPRMAESTSKRDQGLVAWEVLLNQSDEEDKAMQEQQCEMKRRLDSPIACVASTNQDTMYYHQAIVSLTGNISKNQFNRKSMTTSPIAIGRSFQLKKSLRA